MKKLFMVALVCTMTVSAMAQIKSVDVKANLRGDFGIGAGITMPVLESIDFAPTFNYYFADGCNMFTVDADFHYNFELDQTWTIYPMAGLLWFHNGVDGIGEAKGEDYNKLGVNIGVGARYDINDRWAAIAEAKYQWVDGWDDTFFSLGVNYKF